MESIRIICSKCGYEQKENANFCPKCGAYLKEEIPGTQANYLALIIVYFIIRAIFAGLYTFTELFDNTLESLIVVEVIDIILALLFASFNIRGLLPLYKTGILRLKTALLLIALSLAFALAIYHLVSLINQWFFEVDYSYVLILKQYDVPVYIVLVFTALLAPVFEELACRGFLFNYLLRLTTAKNTIVITGFLFAIIHISFFSMLWIFPFGIFLGYLRNKYNTLWYPMLIHFVHNTVVTILEYYEISFI